MTWQYSQSDGRLSRDGELCGIGYSGAGDGKNNPAMEGVQCVGPIVRGRYTINAPVDTKSHGPYVMWLTPHPDNDMLGRSAFGIHGDSKSNPGSASLGCIAIERKVREQVWESGDRDLVVT